MIWSDIIYNLLFIIGLNKATYFRYCTVVEKDMEYCDGKGVDKESKYVLWFIRYYSLKFFGHYLSKPICTCIPCMASIWGTAGYWITHQLTVESLYIWPIYVMILSGLGTIAERIINVND